MKKIHAFVAAIIVLAAAASVAVIVNAVNSDSLFEANVEALAQVEDGVSCTGPKKENVAGNIFCHSENTAPCKDMYGCK